jgi:hypothetical protein
MFGSFFGFSFVRHICNGREAKLKPDRTRRVLKIRVVCRSLLDSALAMAAQFGRL